MSEVPGARLRRNQEIQQRISGWLMSDPGHSKAVMNSAEASREISILRDVLLRVDEGMRSEQIPQDTRDSIIHLVIYGSPPKDPQAEGQHLARLRLHGLEPQTMSVLTDTELETL